MAIYLPGKGPKFICWACGTASDQQHHATYQRRLEYDHRFERFPLCEACHADVHRLHDHLDRQVSLLLLTLWYVHDPVLTVQQVHAIHPRQLDFGQQPTPQGEAWRAWQALYDEFRNEWDQDEAA